MEYSFQIDKLPEKINFLNNKAREINRNLFLFDDFKLKKVPHIVDEEIVFWYLIVNLYGLFFDAGKYIRDLDIWNYDSYCKVKAFYYALNEVRSVFCHNKSNASYLRGKVINKKLNKLIPGCRRADEEPFRRAGNRLQHLCGPRVESRCANRRIRKDENHEILQHERQSTCTALFAARSRRGGAGARRGTVRPRTYSAG